MWSISGLFIPQAGRFEACLVEFVTPSAGQILLHVPELQRPLYCRLFGVAGTDYFTQS